MTTFRCPGCDTRLKAKPEQGGRRFRCPKCKTPVTVPADDEQGSATGHAASAAQTGTPQADLTRETASKASTAEEDVPEIWQPGDVILDLYEVKEVLGEGGFGKVYRVHHRGWNMDLAVKSPRAGHFKSDREKENFIAECQTWIELGLHPHTVSCYYVRKLGGVPRVFTELVDGKDLKDWIAQKSTLELKTALDIAVQIAWGMAYAHERGLVHRDLKPANVLMLPDATAKVTDFGLARHGITSTAEDAGDPAAGIQVSTAAGTPGYMAPEQASLGSVIDRRADVFAFGVTLWRMLGGDIPWAQTSSAIAKRSVEALAKKSDPPSLPVRIVEFILRCLEPEPEDRWADFAEVVAQLQAVWSSFLEEEFPRTKPETSDLLADGLNNRGVSFLDLGQAEKAEEAFSQALRADPHHIEATYNRGLVQWRSGRITDTDLIRQLEEVRSTQTGAWLDEYYLGMVHLERGDGESALKALREAAGQSDNERLVSASLASAEAVVDVVRTFDGHTRDVTSVTFSPDGRRVLSGSLDDTLRLWELSTGRCLRTIAGNANMVYSVAVSADGQRALSGGDNRAIRLWELSTGRCLRVFGGHGQLVSSVAVSPDGRLAVSGSHDKTIRLWELSTGRCLRTLEGHTNWVACVAISPDGRYALSGSHDNTVRLWELPTGRCVSTCEGHARGVISVAFAPHGHHALSGGSDNTVRLWELSTGRCLRTFTGHTSLVDTVAISPDGRHALSGGDDCTVRLWKMSTGRCLRTFERDGGRVHCVAISPDGHWAILGRSTLQLWELRFPPPVSYAVAAPTGTTELQTRAQEVLKAIKKARAELAKDHRQAALSVMAEARQIIGYERHRELVQLHRQLGRSCARTALITGWCAQELDAKKEELKGNTQRGESVDISPNGRYVLSGGDDNVLRLWDLSTSRCIRKLAGHTDMVYSVAISSDGGWALSGSMDNTLRMWELSTGQCVRTLEVQRTMRRGVTSVVFGPGDLLALSGNADNTLRLWELSTGRCLRAFKGHSQPVRSVAISPDGQFAVSGSSDKTIRLWELATGRCLRTLEGHTDHVGSVAISPDGRHALSGSDNTAICLWELSTGHCLRTINWYTGILRIGTTVAISPDGRWALSGGGDFALRLWECSTGRCLRAFEGHRKWVSSVAFSPDGCCALSGSFDRTVRLWELDWKYEYPGEADWDEGARAYLETFLTRQTPPEGQLPEDREPTEQEIVAALTRRGRPTWDDRQFKWLIRQLQYAGYGWLRPEGVRKKLEEMAANWTGPPPLPGGGE